MDYLRIMVANNYQRGHTRWAQPPGRAREPRRTLVGCGLLGPPPVPIFWYISDFDLEKNKEKTFGTERRRLEAELGQKHFCPPVKQFCRGNFPPGGGNHRPHHHQQLFHLGGGQSPSTYSTTPSPLKP